MVKRVQRTISGILAVAMMILMFPSLTLTAEATQSRIGGFLKTYTLTGDGATDMVNIALAQEGLTGADIGYTEQWCGNFVSDCAILAGQTAAVPQNGLASSLYTAVMNAGGTITTKNPQPGDLVFINWNGGTSISHVEIIYKVSGSSLYTIGGNSGSTGNLYTRYVKKHAPLGSSYVLYVVRPAYTSQVTDYLNRCTYYASYATVTAGTGASLWSIPCTDQVNSEAVLLAQPDAGKVFTATGIYLNTAGEYWYHVTYNGTACYLYGGDISDVTPLYSDLSISNVTAPSSITCGLSFSIAGTIKTEYNMITNVMGRVFTDDTLYLNGTAEVNTKSFSLRSSTVDKGMKFGTLPVGRYYYDVMATVSNCHTLDGLTLTYTSDTQTLYTTAFNVVPAADTKAPVISDVVVENLTDAGYKVLATVTDNAELAQVTFSTWTERGNQDDLVTVNGTADGSVYTTQVLTADHGGETGTYITQISATDASGNTTVCQVEAEVPAPVRPEGMTWSLNNGTLTISGTGDMDNYTYKSEMPWYSSLSQIKAVVIEDGITSISDYAFYGMPNLKTISIPDTVTQIGSYAFKNSTALDGVVLPAGLTKLGESAFYGCTSLTAIDIPASLWSIQPYTFKNCTALTEVTFHEGNLMKIWESAFYNTGLTGVVLPDCLDIVDAYAFKNCADLASITLGSGLTEIREASFYGTSIPTMDIPDGITKIGPYAFKNAVKLTSVSLPSTLTTVDEAAFYGCTGLKTLELPDSLTTIGSYAFRKCSGLTNVSFGAGLTAIGEASFYGCTGLSSLTIPAGVTTIGGYAFKACTGLNSVSLPSTLTTLGDSAFHTCSSLSKLTIPANVKSIGAYCFSGSCDLWQITFTGNAPAIGTRAFNGLDLTAYYPGRNTTWTADVMQNYGGNVTWKAQ